TGEDPEDAFIASPSWLVHVSLSLSPPESAHPPSQLVGGKRQRSAASLPTPGRRCCLCCHRHRRRLHRALGCAASAAGPSPLGAASGGGSAGRGSFGPQWRLLLHWRSEAVLLCHAAAL